MAGGTFPTSAPTYTVTVGTETLNGASGGAGLSGLLNNLETDVTALAAKMGTGAATPTSGKLLRGNGTGTSTWGQLVMSTDVAAFTSADIRGVVNDETGSGVMVFGTSPTIVTPTIASFANANHTHTNSAGGGTLGFTALTSTIFSGQLTTYTNPGTAGGTNSFFYLNWGGIKMLWGQSNALTATGAAPATGTGTLTLPVSFFTTIQMVQVGTAVASASQYVAAGYTAVSASSITLEIVSWSGTGGSSAINVLVIGT